jgi:anti-sigma regulatory factor (Ser/Thr protein kinase)
MPGPETHAHPNGHAAGPDGVALDQPFGSDDLYALRAAVAAHAMRLGAPPDRVAHLVIVASELASNAIRHGGGRGRLRLSRVDGAVRCEVSDAGPGITDPAGAGTVRPPAMALGGRGLFIVRRLTVSLTIASTERGTTVTALVAMPGSS